MRYALLLLIATLASGADEVFTLADGRTFTGTYDEEAGVLHTTTPAGRAFDLKLAGDQIAGREWAKKGAKATPVAASAPVAAAPVAMTAEAKAMATRDFAYQQKVREADGLDADAVKAKRDAAEARKMAERQLDHARNDWLAFCDRSEKEGVPQNRAVIADQLIVLPRTKGNNRAAMEGLAESKQTAAKAIDLDALAVRKAGEAATARSAAEALPHGDAARAAPTAPAIAVAAPAAVVGQIGDLLKAYDAAEADLKAQRAAIDAKEAESDARFARALALPLLPLPVLSADPRKSEVERLADTKRANGAVGVLRSAVDSGDVGTMHSALHRPEVHEGLAAYARVTAP